MPYGHDWAGDSDPIYVKPLTPKQRRRAAQKLHRRIAREAKPLLGLPLHIDDVPGWERLIG